ncbi:MAG TPA: class I SAM-dependent RNA methyltransferase [Candidatus Binatia bacterium]|jgi:23S rRNA (guanine2445-N2)-methyltransferase / 23S rRNA (guanine2069-N7)-methyltransferase
MPLDLVAASTFGVEAVVARELDALGYQASPAQTGRIHFEGDRLALARANIQLRSADRVFVRLAEFPAPDFDALFETVLSIPWQDWIARDEAFPVTGRSVRSTLSSVPALQRTVKKAISMRLGEAFGVRSLAETGAVVPIEIALLHDTATLLLDTSGDGLHKRGYRDLVGAAPLRETLAAALVDLSFWKNGKALIDPFCGSGTIAIEAALAGRRIAPGVARSFAAEGWSWMPAEVWAQAREEAQDQALERLDERIIATDIDAEALSLARRHAARAGVEADIHFQKRAFADLETSHHYGCIVTNPPYGVRLEDDDDVRRLYESMAAVFERLPTWSFFVLTPWRDFESIVRRRADRRRKLYNARIECTYFQFHGPKPPRADGGGTGTGTGEDREARESGPR